MINSYFVRDISPWEVKSSGVSQSIIKKSGKDWKGLINDSTQSNY